MQGQGPRGGPPGTESGGETGRPESAVEGVEKHAVERPRPADLHFEAAGQQAGDGGTVQRCRQHKLSPADRTGRSLPGAQSGKMVVR
jgi:hypothetical protein